MQKDCTHRPEVCIVKRKHKKMKVYCKKCLLPLTKELMLYTGTSFGEAGEQPYIQPGYYATEHDFFTGFEGCVVVNLEDLVNVNDHTDKSRLNGCCGLDGCDGPNKVCSNGHEVATEKSDCWMPYAVLFDKEKTFLK